jgi:hypothetical protein
MIFYSDENALDYTRAMIKAHGLCKDPAEVTKLKNSIKDDLNDTEHADLLVTQFAYTITLGFWFNKHCVKALGHRSAVLYMFDTQTGKETVSTI